MGPWYSTIYEILRTAYASNMPENFRSELKKSCEILASQIQIKTQKAIEIERKNCIKICKEIELNGGVCSLAIQNQNIKN